MTSSNLSSNPSLEQLPDNYAIKLSNFSAIAITGEEKVAYLQGQVTCDVNSLSPNNMLNGAHCDAKGKVLSVFRLINRLESHLLLQPQSSIEQSLSALQKFGVFAKVTISEDQSLGFYALVGDKSAKWLHETYNLLPDCLNPVQQIGSTTVVYIAGQQARYLIIDDQKQLDEIITAFEFDVLSAEVWQLSEICEGFPILSPGSIEQYVPQMLNLQAINGISFTKGCYLGQETVARMQYLGKNKRALFSLVNTSPVSPQQQKVPVLVNLKDISTGDIIEQQLGENWRKAGSVLASYQSNEGNVYLQAVLNSDLNKNTSLRLKNNTELTLTINDLPYSTEQKE